MAGRSRSAVRREERRRAGEDVDRTWMKWARCSVCRSRFCVNNFADREVRRERYKFLYYWLCPKCEYHEGKFWIKLMVLTKRLAADSVCPNQPERCKCPGHVAFRLIEKHNELRLGP